MNPTSDHDVRRLLSVVHGAAAQMVEGDLDAADVLLDDLGDLDAVTVLAVASRSTSVHLRSVVADVPAEARREFVEDLTAGAELLGAGDPVAVGFAGVLVDAMTRHDEETFAGAFAAALEQCPVDELVLGVVSLLAATIVERAARRGTPAGELAAAICWAAAANEADTTVHVA